LLARHGSKRSSIAAGGVQSLAARDGRSKRLSAAALAAVTNMDGGHLAATGGRRAGGKAADRHDTLSVVRRKLPVAGVFAARSRDRIVGGNIRSSVRIINEPIGGFKSIDTIWPWPDSRQSRPIF